MRPPAAAGSVRPSFLPALARGFTWILLAAWTVVLVVWLTLHWGILPHLDRWKPDIERRASAAIGAQVHIGSIIVRTGSWVPAVELRDIVLTDAEGRPALSLPRVTAALSVRSLFALELRFAQLLIDGAALDVRRDAEGRIVVGGLTFGARKDDPGAGADWFFKQPEFVIRGGTLRWTDEMRQAPTLALTDVQVVVRNGLLSHDLRVDATPPPEWGDRFTWTGRFMHPLLGRAGDWKRWAGSAHANLPRADVSQLRRHVDLPFELDEGNGALRVWVDVKGGEVTGATADLALRAVRLKLSKDLEPLALAQVEGRLEGARDANGFKVALKNFGFVTDDGLRWPAGDMNFAWRQREGQPAQGGEFGAQRLDLALVAQVATRVPLSAGVRGWLADAQPQGLASDLALQWSGSPDDASTYRVRGAVAGLSWRASEAGSSKSARPGLSHADVAFDASERGGSGTFAVRQGMVEFPGLFEEPQLPLESVDAQITWRVDRVAGAKTPRRVSLQISQGRVANADLRADFNARWTTGDGANRFPGRLDLTGRMGPVDASRIVRYLPAKLVGARDYLRLAVRSGQASGTTVRIRGNLNEFPFAGARASRDNEFRVVTRVEDADFAYVPARHSPGGPEIEPPAWPPFTQMRGELIFDRASMEIRNAQAQVFGLTVSNVQGGVPAWGEAATLSIGGTVDGPLSQLLSYTNTAPVGGWLHGSLASVAGTGDANLQLALTIPLRRARDSTVQGTLTLPGNDLRWRPDVPLLVGAKARIDFTEHGVTVTGGSGRALGGEQSIEGGTAADGNLRFTMQGTVSADGLRRSELGAVSRLASAWTGQTAYRFLLGFVHGRAEVNLQSNLVGMASNLPAPFAKSAETPQALKLQVTPQPDGARDIVQLDVGTVLQAQYLRDLTGADARIVRGGIGVNEPAPQQAAGVVALVTLNQLDVDAWSAVVKAATPAPSLTLTGRDGDNDPGSAIGAPTGGYMPGSVGLRAQELVAGGRKLTRLVAGASLDDGTWRVNLDAEQLSGYAEYAQPKRGAGRVYARLARLSVPKGESPQQVDDMLEPKTTDVPALDIVVEDLELRGRKLGRVEVQAAHRGSGDAREWQLSRLAVTLPEAKLTATGQWARRRATMDFKLETADSGALLERFDIGRTIKGGKGQLTGQVSWLGSPLSLDIPSLGGRLNLAIEKGQFLKTDPGAARLLSVLSLQSLPRRFMLDFRDVFQEGFAFDLIGGDVLIDKGVARTNNLRMRGLQAAVLMEGQANLARETQDLRVVIVPEINAGTASLAYAVINPAIGLGTFLAQYFLRTPLIQANTREFHVTGTWGEPKIDKVERKAGTPVPDVNAPLPSATSESPPEPVRR